MAWRNNGQLLDHFKREEVAAATVEEKKKTADQWRTSQDAPNCEAANEYWVCVEDAVVDRKETIKKNNHRIGRGA